MNLLLGMAERVIGRRRLWKAARSAYLFARGEGSLDMERNGERLLQTRLAEWSARNKRPLVIMDVGANYGQWSRSFLQEIQKAGAQGSSFTLFEPVPAIRLALEPLAREYGMTATISIEPFAVSDRGGFAKFRVTDIAAGDHHLECEDFSFEGEDIEVEVVSLDDFALARGIAPINMVKIDAEGYDPKVMSGMENILARGDVDIVQFEYSALFVRSRAYLYDIFKLAHRHGYGVATLSHRGIELHTDWHFDLERFYGTAMVLLHPRSHEIVHVRPVTHGADNTYA
jgi:FkbM family methyltransferase